MPLVVASARLWAYQGADGLDVTRKSAPPEGVVFAPSWALLRPYLARRHAQGVLDEEDWEHYAASYVAEMRHSYRDHRAAWQALLARHRVVLLCYCRDPDHCHRKVLRSQILPQLGAVDAGELPPGHVLGQPTEGA